MNIVISSGHGKLVRGASGFIDEVDEARKVVDRTAEFFRALGSEVIVFHDNTSTTQSQNLNTIVGFHNSHKRDLDISVHFNAFEKTDKPMGCEVLYLTQSELARRVSQELARAGEFIDRGPKKRTNLAFLNGTHEPAILIETCFVDSSADVKLYNEHFEQICQAIAKEVVGQTEPLPVPPPVPEPDEDEVLFTAKGRCSHFGGPADMGVSPSEGLAFIFSVNDAPHLFLPNQPPGTTGLARRLNPMVPYIACRWDYEVTPKDMLKKPIMALVRAMKTGVALKAYPADWGPHVDTGRVADLSPGLMDHLGIATDDEVEVIYPYEEELVA